MDLQWPGDVLVILGKGNMTRAAFRRNKAEPAFSRRILGFEDWFGVTGLQRGMNKVDISLTLVFIMAANRALVTPVRGLPGKLDSSIQQAQRF